LQTTPAPPHIYTLSLHDAIPISQQFRREARRAGQRCALFYEPTAGRIAGIVRWFAHVASSWWSRSSKHILLPEAQKKFLLIWKRSEEHTSELQSLAYLVCRLLLE